MLKMKKNKQVFDSIIICSFALIFSSQCISVGNTDDIENLVAVLEDFRQEYNVPALAAAVFQNDRIVACGVTGVRVTNSRNQVIEWFYVLDIDWKCASRFYGRTRGYAPTNHNNKQFSQ